MENAFNIFVNILKEYERIRELREICIGYSETGELSISGREMLIEELKENEYNGSCIKVIIAASAGYYDIEAFKKNCHQMDQLKEIIKKHKSEIDIESWFKNCAKNLIQLSPELIRVSFNDEIYT